MATSNGIDQVGRPGGPKLVGLSEVSSQTGISERTLRRWCASGLLPALDVTCGEKQPHYKTTWDDVREALARRRVRAQERDVAADVAAQIQRERSTHPPDHRAPA